MGVVVLGGFIVVIIGMLWLLQWLKSHCPACRKPWRETGQLQDGGLMAGRRAYLKEWHCSACGQSAWIKSF
jgi:hypothetical protein